MVNIGWEVSFMEEVGNLRVVTILSNNSWKTKASSNGDDAEGTSTSCDASI